MLNDKKKRDTETDIYNIYTLGPWLLLILVAVFTCAHFQKRLQICSLCDFHYMITHAFLVTNDLNAADFVHADFCQT